MERPKCPSVDEWTLGTAMGRFHNGILVGCKEEDNFTLCDSVDGPGEHYVK